MLPRHTVIYKIAVVFDPTLDLLLKRVNFFDRSLVDRAGVVSLALYTVQGV